MGNRFDAVVSQIRRLGAEYQAQEPDEALLARFLATHDAAAFEALIRRYGPMVYSVCRRATRTESDAEDAFQATFLQLVRRAGTVYKAGALGGWLHTTAVRAAGRARAQAARRSVRERLHARPEAAPTAPEDGREVRAVLDEELDRLPDKYRRPVVLCRLLELPLAAAATQLGLSVATVWRRLTRGEELLRAQLTRRGVTAPLAVVAGTLGSAAMPERAVAGTLEAAVALRAGGAALVPAWGRALVQSPAAWWGSGSVVAAALAIGVGVTWFAVPRPEAAVPVAAPVPAAPEPVAVVPGQVLDATGRPAARVQIAVLARRWENSGSGLRDEVVARGETDAEGRFRIDVRPFTVRVAPEEVVHVFATGNGTAVAQVVLERGRQPAALTLRLSDGRGVTGRVVDEAGKPVAGATVSVNRFGGVAHDPRPVADPATDDVWPKPVATAADGTFTLTGLDPQLGYRLGAAERDRSVGFLTARPNAGPAAANVTVRVVPVRPVRGQVLAADTAKPLGRASVDVTVMLPSGPFLTSGTADAEGRFAIPVPKSAAVSVRVTPSGDTPYLRCEQSVAPGPDGAVPAVEVRVPRGVRVTGRVADAATGVGIPIARVWCVTRTGAAADPATVRAVPAGTATDTAGRFVFTVPPGEVTVLATTPTLDYASLELDAATLEGPAGTGRRVVAHATAAIKTVIGRDPAEVTLRPEPGRAVECRATLPDGSAVAEGRVLCRHIVGGRDLQTPLPLPIRDGRFVVPGCRPGQEYAIQVVDRAGRHGANAVVRCPAGPSDPAAPVAVQLAACDPVTVELIDRRERRPIEGQTPELWTVLPGTKDAPAATVAGRWWDDAAIEPRTNRDGRSALRGLISGATYRARFPEDGYLMYLGADAAPNGTFRPRPERADDP